MRVTAVNDAPVNKKGDYVLYWMIAARRTTYNFALDHAIAVAKELERPLVVFEPLRAGYRWACDRFHTFVMQGMADNAKRFAAHGITYFPYVEPEPDADKGLLEALAKHACCVITDEQPGFFLPRMVASAGKRLAVQLEQVDGNGLIPLRAVTTWFPTAHAFRRQIQKTLPSVLEFPSKDPLRQKLIKDAALPKLKWKSATDVSKIPIDHAIKPVDYAGGSVAAAEAVDEFFDHKLARYADDRRNVDDDASSGLSPYLHFGHVSPHELTARIFKEADRTPDHLATSKVTGSREGWWGLPAASEAFLDELVTWRELGYVFCHYRADYGTWESLPEWARKTLTDHAKDPRPEHYTHAQLEAGDTEDEIWNAAQHQLVTEGRIHNYLRMLWGKKILEWSKTPKQALATLIELNNKYCVDGRDPNSYSGILWTLGLFDRPWGPVRPIFGTIRYMSSEQTKKKLVMKQYLAKHS
ncbi:MAG: deoxyribodipyrimidine photolyase [Kofleriaceae bacterium]